MKHIIITGLILFFSFTLFGDIPPVIKLNTSDITDIHITEKSMDGFSAFSSLGEISWFQVKTTKGMFVQLMADGYNYSMNTGYPQLPVLKRLIEIPWNADVSIEVISCDEEVIDLSNYGISSKIIPSQPPLQKGIDPSTVDFEYNRKAYSRNSFDGNPLVDVKILGVMRGVRIARLEISPVQYNPATNQLKIINNLIFKVHFENADFQKTDEMRTIYYSPAFEKNMSKMLNYNAPAQKDIITTYPQKYVIVADPMFQTQLQPFIEWKTKKGFIVVEAYTNNPSVGTSTATIKAYLEGLYDNATINDPAPTYVLFVGDVAQIPVFTGTTSSHVTDLYYCTYDGAGDFYPDVYYGRFSATNAVQLQPQIDKTLEYEQYLFPNDQFLNHVVLVSGVDATYAPTYGNGQINYGTDNYFNLAHGITDHTWLYPASGSPGTSANIRAQVSEGCSFLNYTAHCGPSGWADPSFTVTDVYNLTNAHEYPLSVGNCCSSNEFQEPECFGEALLRAENKGALGHIGGSNSTYWSEDYWWGVGNAAISSNPTYAGSGLGAYDCLFHDHGEPDTVWFITSDQMLHAGNLAVTEAGSSLETYYWEVHHLMGDPSIMPYLSVPPALSVSYTDPIPVGSISLDVTTEPHSYVALSENGVLLDAKYTGNGTDVTLEFPPIMNPGDIDIVITKQFRKPYINTVSVVPGNTTNDGQVTTITVPATYTSIMDADVMPSFTIRNLGTANLTSAQTGYFIDSGTPVTQAWNGNLAQYQTQQVTFPQITLPAGTHTFTAFVSMPNGVDDEYHPGDTIVKTFHVTAGDAAVMSHNTFQEIYCNPDTITPSITFANKGTVNLLSVDINYQIDSQATVTIPWTGNLAPNEQATVNFPTITLLSGNHTFTSFTSNPNGGSDENPTNDSKQSSFEVYAYAQMIIVTINTDDFGSETTWEIKDDTSGVVLYSGGPYSDWDPQSYNEEVCLGHGCYTFTINDSWGDGQDGYTTDGSYAVNNATTSQNYGSGSGNWGYSASVNFCIDLTSTDEFSLTPVIIYPNPAQDFLYLENLASDAIIVISDLSGKTIASFATAKNNQTVDISAIPAGIYNLSVTAGEYRFYDKFVIAR